MILYIISILFATCACIVVASLVCRFTPAGRLMSKIPSDKGMPIFLNAFDINKDPEQLFAYIRGLYKKFKGIYAFKAFHYRHVNIFDPQDVEKILSVHRYNDKGSPYGLLTAWLGTGLVVNNGDKWRERRKMLAPTFHFKLLKKFYISINEQTEELLNVFHGEANNDKTAILPLLKKFTLRVICETSMGISMKEDIESVVDKYISALNTLGECIVYRFTRIWLYSNFLFRLTQFYRIQTAALADLHNFTKQMIRERREFIKENNVTTLDDDDDDVNGKSRMAMLDLLFEQEKLGNIDEEGIRNEVDTAVFGAHDTTAIALNFMMMKIANEPIVQDLIYKELQRVLGQSTRSPTMKDLNEMTYLECCVKESLRLYPSVPFISRVIHENVELSGYTIPKSTEVNIHIFDIHRREDIYPEPEKFIPERFLPENSVQRHPYAYIPFSAGPRNCIGRKYAMVMLKSVMAGVIRRFRLEPVTRPEDITFVADLALCSADPVYVKFTKRNNGVE